VIPVKASPLSASELLRKILAALPPSRACNLPSTLFVLSGKTDPRWIFPPGSSINRVLAGWSPYAFASRMKWQVVLAAQRADATGLLPHVKTIRPDAAGINWQRLGWNGSTPPVPAIYMGTPGPRQKAVIHLVDAASGRCGAVVKVPLQPSAREAIVRESDVLSVLEDELCISSPRLLYVDRARGISSQSFLTGSSGLRRFLPEYQDLLRSLVLLDERTTLAGHAAAWHDHPVWDYLNPQELALMSSALAEQSNTSSLPACWVHGDFVPWNIRHRSRLCPSLIDWEIAERAGLPLQDALHFLHMQQFLFESHPRTFHETLEMFAKSLGIASFLCRKLEIAYLAQSYLSCIAWEEHRRAEFLRKTLAIVVRQRPRPVAVCETSEPRRLRLVASRPANRSGARVELFSQVVSELNASAIPYCILSGYELNALAGTSDVDIMFRPEDLRRVPPLLAKAAAAADSRLVQCIQHETSASYFGLAKPDGKHVHHLAIDCYGDYRRDGRTWLEAGPLVGRRRQYRDIWRPASADEFLYRLVKDVLKRTSSAEHLKRLYRLLAEDAAGGQAALSHIWSDTTVAEIERAILQQDLRWFREALPTLQSELFRARQVQGRWKRTRECWRDLVKGARRILFPTGILLAIRADEPVAQQALADRLLCSLAQAFRRRTVAQHSSSLPRQLLNNLAIRAARIRSTLVVDTDGGGSVMSRNVPFGVSGIRLFAAPDLVLHLKAEAGDAPARRSAPRSIALESSQPLERLAEQANRAVLDWMATRVARRLKLATPWLPDGPDRREAAVCRDLELESVGSD
jgi:hypothetical protein